MGVDPEASGALIELSVRLRRLRFERGLTYVALERRAGLGHTTVSRTLNGRKLPTEGTVVALAKALGADPGPLLVLRERAAEEIGQAAVRADDVPFEERYCRCIVERHSGLTIVGLDLRGAQPASWPLEPAYVSLELTSRRDDSLTVVERAEKALAGQQRALVRGLAGSGKTTLVQWLAVTSARRGSIPFVIPLRRLDLKSAPPAPERFLEAIRSPLAAAQPPGWADRVLTEGRALLLVDGIDEVPAQRREETKEWLRDLIAAYPRSSFIVTTRPTAVPERWLESAGFAELTVRPMNRKDVLVFATRWHTAAGTASDLEERFKDAVRAQRPLAQLATTPLMCALMCALHRDRRGRLPRSRMELYEAALAMLLGRRDDERGIEAPEGISLTQHEAVQLLQRLAYWLIRNGQAEMEEKTALTVFEDALPAMPAVAGQGDARQVLTHLVSRCGLLRRPTADTVDFVHRTFQDYLGAKAAVEGHDLGLLVRNADDDRWEDVIRMAVAHARPAERAALLRQLMARGDQAPDHRTRLHLLAMACLEQATELDPEVRAKVEERAATLLPPRSYAEAQNLATVGPVILDLLPGPQDLPERQAEAVVHAAAAVGGDAALTLLKRYRDCRSPRVFSALSRSWGSFDTEEFAKEILNHLPAECDITVRSRAALELVPSLPQNLNIQFMGDLSADEILAAVDPDRLTSIALSANQQLSDVAFLQSLPKLRELRLFQCPEITDLSPLDGLPLTTLLIHDTRPHDLRRVTKLPELKELNLDLPIRRSHTSSLPAMPKLRKLYVWQRNASRSLTGLEAFDGLEYLGINALKFPEGGREELTRLPQLTHLMISEQDMTRLAMSPTLPQVRELTLSRASHPVDLTAISKIFPELRLLRISCDWTQHTVVDLTALASIEHLDVVVEDAKAILGLDLFPPGRVTLFPGPRY
ncbi:NACHT domain-containing protein [Streptomyces hesseae]|uniref:NACHT domain-containing protein n=1 Tax=Streptomyces hesseae TaxID=3075519 RepID=A0ABU2SM61_9ACTN|nr:NACHT domain-containing protein [Streptomyces sp. DSM 40473]MDT0450072.1 NACHT domain-containing protein [Streptomyces sp. DSM 40473]